jgi:UDP-N-acetylmuramoyl-tripeptide--D-alanyl-D-alanine ligase
VIRRKKPAKATKAAKKKTVAKRGTPKAKPKTNATSKPKTKAKTRPKAKPKTDSTSRPKTKSKSGSKSKPTSSKAGPGPLLRPTRRPAAASRARPARIPPKVTAKLVARSSAPRVDAVEPSGPAVRTLGFALDAMHGTWVGPPAPEVTFAGAAADSRRVRPGVLFFALPGERVDGFDFCAAAATAGAAAVVIDGRRGEPAFPAGGPRLPVIAARDSLTALGDLARAVRAEFAGAVIGITGSNGKTTTKELTAAALGAAGSVLRTEGNYNTEIGLPLTILSSSGRETFWVLEMAMRGQGQIALLADIARPHVGVITNVAGAHVELLGSIEAVARAKGELFAGLGPDGVAVLPGGDPLIEPQAAHVPEGLKWRFDPKGTAAVTPSPGVSFDVSILEIVPAGVAGQIVRYAVANQPVVARLPLGGEHNAVNAGAALAVAAALDVPAPEAAAALARTRLPPHRSAPVEVAGRIVLDDCYNANPASMRAALAAVGAAAAGGGDGARAFAILGDMLELGPDAAAQHHAVGRGASALAGLVAVGPLAAEIARGAKEAGLSDRHVVATADPASAAATVAGWTRPGDWILVKASRGMRLERAIDALREEFRLRPAMT